MKKRRRKGLRAAWNRGIKLFVVLCAGTMILWGWQGSIRMKSCEFTESAKELHNPGRGFYNLYRFMIEDEETDYGKIVQELYVSDKNTRLTLVEINLQNYRDGGISREGIANIDALFQELAQLDKQLIVRFVYDWDGENEKYEPETIDIILEHMGQLESVLKKFDERIFVLQGLFVGNWGEMNNTKYDSGKDMVRLMEKLDDAAGPSVFFAVRTPRQWRMITGLQGVPKDMREGYPLAGRISLYNDGMLGNESDYGTYKIQNTEGESVSERKKELDFQDQLCRWVPNGGEAINDNYYNDFERAVKDLASMHVTYLNEGHDLKVLEKWRETVITEEGCYKGMDGYTYIERHLGYRLLIDKVSHSVNSLAGTLEINVAMRNTGFAPIYVKPEAGMILYDEEKDTYLSYEMEGDLRQLPGGDEAEERLTLTAALPTDRLMHTRYKVYFFITDPVSGERILLANEQDEEKYGYHIGDLEVYPWFNG